MPAQTSPALPTYIRAAWRVVSCNDPQHQPGTVLEIARTIYRIGRAPGNDLLISSETVSRQHATLKYEHRTFVLQDEESRNGTFVRHANEAIFHRITRLELAQAQLYVVRFGSESRNLFEFAYENEDTQSESFTDEAQLYQETDAVIAQAPAPTSTQETRAMPALQLPPFVHAHLRLLEAPAEMAAQEALRLNERSTFIGRSNRAHLALSNSVSISRQHVRLDWSEQLTRFVIIDLESITGTRLNSGIIAPNQEIQLEPNRDYHIFIGVPPTHAMLVFRYRLGADSAEDQTLV